MTICLFERRAKIQKGKKESQNDFSKENSAGQMDRRYTHSFVSLATKSNLFVHIYYYRHPTLLPPHRLKDARRSIPEARFNSVDTVLLLGSFFI
jgi:hypothetical protein